MTNLRPGIITTARSGSTRLPAKALLPVAGTTLLGLQIQRLLPCGLPVIVATTNRANDDRLADEAARCGAEVFRGDELDVLGRVCQAAQAFDINPVVLTWGDSPLLSPDIVLYCLEAFTGSRFDFVSTKYNFPQGLDCEVFSRGLLEKLAADAGPDEREHVSGLLWKYRAKFRGHSVIAPVELQAPEYVLTVDVEADYLRLLRIVEHFGPDVHFSATRIVELLRSHPELAAIRIPPESLQN